MTIDELGASDAALRDRITELSVHIACGELRGPVSGGRWQSCSCEDDPEEWDGCAVSREQELCVICLTATAGGTSRWEWLACKACRQANDTIAGMRDEYGDQDFALTRYALTNGRVVSVEPQDRRGWFHAFAHGDDRVRQWCEREYHRLASKFEAQADVPLRIWQREWPPGIETSVDAFARLHDTLDTGSRSDQVESPEAPIAPNLAPTERLTELSVHVPCGRVRGPISGRWQSCPCEDRPEKWDGYDVSQERDLCLICGRGTAGGTSKWAWLACEHCRSVNDAIRSKYRMNLPLGRHSIMNGYCVHGSAPPERQREQAGRLAQVMDDQRALFEWRDREVTRLSSRFPPAADVTLRVWLEEFPPSREATIDALMRLTGGATILRGLCE